MTRAILQIAWGPMAGRKYALAAGDVLRVGRDPDADVVLGHDRALGPIHFEIDWDGATCELRHRRGDETRLGGRRVERASVPHGGWIGAGQSGFLLHFERHTPPARPAPALGEERTSAVLAELRRVPHLWAVLDAARTPRILQVLREAIDPARSLYEGPQGDGLADAAPHLVELRSDSHLLEQLVREGWGDAWGIFFAWDTTEKEARRHLRRLLMVEEDATRERLYFRFYDPRALREVVPTCSVRQLGELFGEIDTFLLEGAAGELLRYARSDLHALAEVDP